jgi:hypothetical protein
VTLYKIGDRVRVRVVTLAQTGRMIPIQTSTELDTVGTTDPLFYKFRPYVLKLTAAKHRWLGAWIWNPNSIGEATT